MRGVGTQVPPPVQIAAALKYAGDVDVLVCCAGASYPGMYACDYLKCHTPRLHP